MKWFLRKIWEWTVTGLFLAFMSLVVYAAVMIFMAGIANAHYIPAVTDQQLSIATMGKITKDRYKDNFGLDVLFIQRKLYGDTQLLGIGSVSQYDGEERGGLNAFALQPLGQLVNMDFKPKNKALKENIFNRINLIVGAGINQRMEAEAAAGVQIDLERVIIFAKRLGRRSYRGGIIFPIFNREIHFGFIGEHRDLDDIHERESVDKLGIVIGMATDSKQSIEQIERGKTIDELKRDAEKIEDMINDKRMKKTLRENQI